MISLKNINVLYGSKHVLKDLTCSAQNGDFVVIVGTNGAGKSSLFDTIAGRVKPQSGTVTLDNVDVTSLNECQRAGLVTRIFQNTNLNSVGTLTVHQNLSIALYSRRNVRLINGMQDMPRDRAKLLVQKVGLSESILDQPMNSLSGGQRQLIAFVMATQLKPKLLLLDEPTAALDPQASTILLSYASRFIKEHKITTMLITHDPYIALNIGNKVWVLENGKISREFNESEKSLINPEQLIGQIDYEKIKW